MPSSITSPQSDLSRAKSIEADDSWPTKIEIVAYYGKEGRKGKRVAIEISGDQFFGRGVYGAPISGDQLIAMVERLRRQAKD